MCGVSTEVDQLVPTLLTDCIKQNENEIENETNEEITKNTSNANILSRDSDSFLKLGCLERL